MQRPGHERATTALLEIAGEISGRLELTECLNRICEITGAALNADRSTVILWSARKGAFVAAADVGTPTDVFARFRSATFTNNGSAYMTQLAAGEIVVITRESADAWGRQLLSDLGVATQIMAPFSSPGAPPGSLTLGYDRPVQPHSEDLDLLRGIAQQAVVAIKTARLFTNAQKAAAFRASLSDLAILLGRERDVGRAVEEVCDTARRGFGVDAALLALVDDGRLTIRGATGDQCAGLVGRAVTGAGASATRVEKFRAGRTWYVNRCRSRAGGAGALLDGLPVEAVLVAPIVVDERSIGVLILADLTEPDRFSDVHAEEATILAATAGAWIENSRLLTALRDEGAKLAERTEHLQTANRELAHKSEELASANSALEDLIYAASHDLRGPLINLEGFTYELIQQQQSVRTLLKGEGSEVLAGVDEALQFIRHATARLATLVRGLLDVSRCGTRELVCETVNVATLVADVVASQRFALSSASIDVQVQPLPSVWADPIGLIQVFDNLIGNAVKYMGAAARRVIEIGYEDGVAHRFVVRDSGPGISVRDQAKVFRLFQRGGHANVPGEGIGLTVVQRIIERHGGKVWVESTLGAGAAFWFTLPKVHA